MTSNEIARKLQRLLAEYEVCRNRYREQGLEIAEATAGHFLASDIGYLITDIDAENERDLRISCPRIFGTHANDAPPPGGTDVGTVTTLNG